MHNIKPNTSYKILTVRVAVPDIDDAEITDGMNEILNQAVMHPNTVVVDWMFESEMAARCSSSEPEEGELF